MKAIKDKLIDKALPLGAELKAMRKEHGDKIVSQVSIEHVMTGMKGIVSLLTVTSKLDPFEGIRFRGYSIPELQEKLPKLSADGEPLPEGLFYLMLLDELPTMDDVKALSADWAERSKGIPQYVFDALDALPIETHPMTQFTVAINALAGESKFLKAYNEGVGKKDYWDSTYEDVMDLIARLPRVAAYIYRRTYHNGNHIEPDYSLDWSGNFAHMMGFDNDLVMRLFRLYLLIHADHEGGNVSAHTTHLVGSALSNPYISFAAGMNGLAGPLHGLANQEVIKWMLEMLEKIGTDEPTLDQIKQFAKDTLAAGQVIPGYGHAVLRKPDPRYMAQREFALKYMPDDKLFKVVNHIYEAVPPILEATGKVKNPWPNVDAHSGTLLLHFGIKEHDFYTVMFGVSRALGVLAQLVWDRLLGLPIERPKSQGFPWFREQISK